MDLFMLALNILVSLCVGWGAATISEVLAPPNEGKFSYISVVVFFLVVGLAAIQVLFP